MLKRFQYIAQFFIVLLLTVVANTTTYGQNSFRVVEGIPHLPVVDPTTITAPQTGMLVFSNLDLKPMIYTGFSWESLCTTNINVLTVQDYFVVKEGIPVLPVFGAVPSGLLPSGTIYYSTKTNAVMVHNGSSWTKMVEMPGVAFSLKGNFTTGAEVKTIKLPVLNADPAFSGLTAGAFYVNAATKAIRYYTGSVWLDVSCQAIVKTLPLTDLAGYTAMSGGEVLSNGSSPVTLTGICWSENANPDTLLTTKTRIHTFGSGIGVFTSQLTGLLPKHTYHVRAYAVNDMGITYGDDITVISPIVPPSIITLPVTDATSVSAQSGGDIPADGGSPVNHRGIIWSSVTDPLKDLSHTTTDDGSGVGYFPSTLDCLLGNTTYYVRAYAVNVSGTSYGNLVSFTTPPPVPPDFAFVPEVLSYSGNAATCIATIKDNGGALVNERGICYREAGSNSLTYVKSVTITPTDIGSYISNLTGLSQGTTYYIKGYAINSAGTGYSTEASFVTSSLTSIVTNKPITTGGTTAESGGYISNTGYTVISARGICWDTSRNPTVDLSTKTSDAIVGDGTGSYNSHLTGLTPGTAYYVRAYAINSAGVAYGNLDSLVTAGKATVSTAHPTKITHIQAVIGGEVSKDGQAQVTARGVCWSRTPNPNISKKDSCLSIGSGIGAFSDTLRSLAANTKYYVRAYATNNIGTAYGNLDSLTTNPPIPAKVELTSLTITRGTTSTSGAIAHVVGNVTDNGGASVKERGFCWNTSSGPAITDTHIVVGNGLGTFAGDMTDLVENTKYYVRAYVINSADITYSSLDSITTPAAGCPAVSTTSIINIGSTTAIGSGYVSSDGGDAIRERGFCWSTTGGAILGRDNVSFATAELDGGTGSFSADLTGLTPNVTYYIRAYAINAKGTSYGNDIVFSTFTLASVTTKPASSITNIDAQSGGIIDNDGGRPVKQSGICWSTNADPTVSDKHTTRNEGIGEFTHSITNLTANTTYHVRAYAINAAGTAYGSDEVFVTSDPLVPSVTSTPGKSGDNGTTASCGGIIDNDGGAPIDTKGIVWSTTSGFTPIITSSDKTELTGDGNFTSTLENLTPGTTYYFRAYATNRAGTAFASNELSFTTFGPPVISTIAPLSTTNSATTTGGNISSTGGLDLLESGICWSTGQLPSITDNPQKSTGVTVFACTINNLIGNTTYYVRAYAKNRLGLSYGQIEEFTTLPPSLAIISTIQPTINSSTTAISGGNILSNGGSLVTTRGIYWSTVKGFTPAATDAHTAETGYFKGSFNAELIGLLPNTVYYVRAYVENSVGIAYGDELSIKTPPLFIVTTKPVSGITNISAAGGGIITNEGELPVSSSGICWNTTGNPTIYDTNTSGVVSTGAFTHNMIGLMGNTKYYARAYAINASKIIYGNTEVFTTLPAERPTITTTVVGSGPDGTTGICGGALDGNGGALISTKGIVWSTTHGFIPDITSANKTVLTGEGSFSSTLENLKRGTTYYARAYATNSAGTGFANNEVSFTTVDAPSLTTKVPYSITNVTANTGGDIVSNGGSAITETGICWSTNKLPTIKDPVLVTDSPSENFVKTISELLGNTTYYVRAYAKNKIGVSYGQVETFETKPPVLATIFTNQPIVSSSTSASCGGTIISHGGALITTHGICWSTQSGFDPSLITTDKTTHAGHYMGSFSDDITGLQSNTVYYFRAYAINSVGIAYSAEMSFQTLDIPSLTTKAPYSITNVTATTGGDILFNGGTAVTETGICWSTTNPPSIDDQFLKTDSPSENFVQTISELMGNTTYYVRAYARNKIGVGYGQVETFTTKAPVTATIQTNQPTVSLATAAKCGGTIISHGGAAIQSYGVCWSTQSGFDPALVTTDKTTHAGPYMGSFSDDITGLQPNTVYYFRAYAINSMGIVYGDEKNFKTYNVPSLTTKVPYSITNVTATTGGDVTTNNGFDITETGICWSTTNPPSIDDQFLKTNSPSDNFVQTCGELMGNTTYYVRAYAKSSVGVGYGQVETFTTKAAVPPTIQTNQPIVSQATAANCGGTIISHGGAAIQSYGVCWSTQSGFDPALVTTDKTTHAGPYMGSFSDDITGLQPNMVYYFRAYAINSVGIVYGDEKNFKTYNVPSLTTKAPYSITNVTATTGGDVTTNNGFDITETGICWSTTNPPTINDQFLKTNTPSDNFVQTCGELQGNTTYYVRAYAKSSVGVGYGQVETLTTQPPVLATIQTNQPIASQTTTASCGGTIISHGGAVIQSYGVCWSTQSGFDPALVTTDKTTHMGPYIGSFSDDITGLQPNTVYYFRAYAINSVGIVYGDEKNCRINSIPFLTTKPTYSITNVTATTGGDIESNGGFEIMETGICWSTSNLPTIDDQFLKTDTPSVNFVQTISDLMGNTTYYVRAYAKNKIGIGYGQVEKFTTKPPTLATIETTQPTMTLATSARCGGNIISHGGSLIAVHGVCWSTQSGFDPALVTTDKTTHTGHYMGSFSDSITGLLPGTIYYFRAYVVNSSGTAYGGEISFKTYNFPAVATAHTYPTGATKATSGGDITDNGGPEITARGVVWSTKSGFDPDTVVVAKTNDGSGTGSFVSLITGLTVNTQYYVRAYATNAVGTSYGNEQPVITFGLATLSTSPISDITNISAQGGGTITNDGQNPVTTSGVCWNTTGNPTVDDNKTIGTLGIGEFIQKLTPLRGSATYYVRAYAINSIGVAYGDEKTFTTLVAAVPTLTTTSATVGSDGTTAVCGGTSIDDGGATISEEGIIWSTTQGFVPDLTSPNKTVISASGEFSSTLAGLTRGTTYYAHAYATNSTGTGFGNEVSFTTLDVPTLTTKVPYAITNVTATTGGDIVSNGGSVVTGSGICWSTTNPPTINDHALVASASSGSFEETINELMGSTTYYIRAYAKNNIGVGYGQVETVTTQPPVLATVQTTTPKLTSITSADCGGNIISHGGAMVTTRGVYWSTTSGFTPSASVAHTAQTGYFIGSFTDNIPGLTPNTTYYVRAYVINAAGTAYGDEMSIKTPTKATVTTASALATGATTATCGGNITDDGGMDITDRGVVWSTVSGFNPNTVVVGKMHSGTGIGSFESLLSGLKINTQYYIRAYATNACGTAYGSEQPVLTFDLATLITSPISEITNISAQSGGTITSDGRNPVTTSGICWNTTGKPTVNDKKTIGHLGIGEFIHNLIPLRGSTTYYVRAYAINSAGIAYGDEKTFTTLIATIPKLTTTPASSGSDGTTAICGGADLDDGGATISKKGIIWSTTPRFVPDLTSVNKTVIAAGGDFSSTLVGLTRGTTYYARAYATNSTGTGYGDEVSFTTLNVPTLTTKAPYAITNVTATGGGNIVSNGGYDVTESGICWSTTNPPTVNDHVLVAGASLGSFEQSISDLMGSTTYYVRSYAKNNIGTGYGQVEIFTTQPPVLATIETTQPVLTSASAANCGGSIISHGGAMVTTRGVYWSTEAGFTPSASVSHTAQTGYFTGSFADNVTGLSPNTTYYVRAYVINAAGIAYGQETSFLTPAFATLTTATVTGIGCSIATSGGDITDNGRANVTSRGVVWSKVPTFNPDTVVVNRTNNGGGSGSFVSQLKNLENNTTYYVQAFATNAVGTAYGNLLSFVTDPAKIPALTTRAATSITGTTVVTGGNISDTGGVPILSRGMVWSTSSGFKPDTVVYNKTVEGSMGTGNFTVNLSGLKLGTTYYARAYATNSIGIAFGDEISFKTLGVPVLKTLEVTPAITGVSATGGGVLINNGGSSLSNQGVCWSTKPNPTTSLYTKTTNDGIVKDTIRSSLTNLKPGTQYYVRVYAVNPQGTGYGEEVSFTTPPILPVVTTTYATITSMSTVATGGNITTDNGSAIIKRGVVWSTNINFNPDTVVVNRSSDGTGSGTFNSVISNMQLKRFYYIRAYATNGVGTSYGNLVTVTLFPTAPELKTMETTEATGTTAMSGGEIISDCGALITLKGICWSTKPNPTTSNSNTSNGLGNDPYTAMLTGLLPNTVYYVRAYAVNKIGTAYGPERIVLTNSIPTLGATTPAFKIIATTASSGGEILSDGRSPILARGICWSTSPNPDISLKTKTVDTSSSDIGSFTAKMTGLTPQKSYYVRAYATNAVGTGYGSMTMFTTFPVKLPTLTTLKPWAVDSISAKGGGNITDDGGMPITDRGICWSKQRDFTLTESAKAYNHIRDTIGVYNDSLAMLESGTKYYIKAFAINSKGVGYGQLDSLVTMACLPKVSAIVATNNAKTSVDVTATVKSEVPLIARGFCWNDTGNPTIDDNHLSTATDIGSLTSQLTGLSEGTAYYIRAYAENSTGRQYGPVYILCPVDFAVQHALGVNGAPTDKTVVYNSVLTTLGGKPVCWLTQNLGAERQPTSATDSTEASAGWYWRFNRLQGHMIDGTSRMPATTWDAIDESSDWTPDNDPCTKLLGTGWRIPNLAEWSSVFCNYGNSTYESPLKLHMAGNMQDARSPMSFYYSSHSVDNTFANAIYVTPTKLQISELVKSYTATPLRCVRDVKK